MKIKWIGKYDGKNLPTVDVGTGAKELPEVTSKSAIILEGSHFQELIG